MDDAQYNLEKVKIKKEMPKSYSYRTRGNIVPDEVNISDFSDNNSIFTASDVSKIKVMREDIDKIYKNKQD
jgi:hypothetical protein